jgi:hypothetical protein
MTLGLDLSSARSKLERAEVHFHSFHEHLPAVGNHTPYSVRVSDIDPNTGWCEIFVRFSKIEEPTLAVIAGDYIHNLRSALDYIVTALANASKTQLLSCHQFPIYTQPKLYEREVGTRSKAVPKGPLSGVRHGLRLIEELQPYNDKPDGHPLIVLNRFANTDKHRHPVHLLFVDTQSPKFTADFFGGLCAEQWRTPEWKVTVDEETKFAAFRFARPFPPKVKVEATFNCCPTLGCPAFPPRYPDGQIVYLEMLKQMFDKVGNAVSRAEAL